VVDETKAELWQRQRVSVAEQLPRSALRIHGWPQVGMDWRASRVDAEAERAAPRMVSAATEKRIMERIIWIESVKAANTKGL